MKLQPNSPENCISSGLSLKKRRPSSDRIGRRLTAMLLVTAMAMGMSVGLLASVDDQIYPPAVQSAEEFPTLTIETNLVKSELTGEPEIEVVEDANGDPIEKYGFVEVALRVKPGLNAGKLIPFIEAGVTLAYEKNILEPITWNYDKNGTEKLDAYDVIEFVDPTTGNVIDPLDAAPLSVNFPAKKTDVIHTGAAFVGGADEGADGDADTEDYVAFSLYAEAQQPTLWSGDRAPVMLEGDSRLVVVRFRYDADNYQMTYNETDKKIEVFDVLNNIDVTATTPLVTWANYTNAAASPTWNNARYVGGEDAQSEMYYVHSVADPALWTDTDSDGLPDALAAWTDTDGDGQGDPPATASDCYFLKAVLPASGGGTSTTAFSLRADPTGDPYAVGRDAYAVSGDTYTTWSTRAATDTYSYTTNFFPVEADWWAAMWPTATDTDPKLRFTQICALTADQGTGGISLDDIVTVVFFDWDETFLGATAVARGMDGREVIDTYVKKTFVHPDIVAANYTDTDLQTLERQYTYRGTYPHASPGAPELTGTAGVDHMLDGDQYLLTNHLDYAFYMTFDDEFYYDDGWAEVTPQTLETTWTTLDSGELEYILTYNTLDFDNDMKQLSGDVSTVYVKAVYTPGAAINTDTNVYTVSPDYEIASYGNATNTIGNYSLTYEYRRVNEQGYGVTRRQEPVLQLEVTPDVPDGAPYYMQVTPKNKDVLEIDAIIAKGMKTVDYLLKEAYGGNVITGAEVSATSPYGTFVNYEGTVDLWDGTQSGVGTDGFVRRATQEYVMEQIRKECAADPTSRYYELTYAELNDAGLLGEFGAHLEDWEDVIAGQLLEVVYSGETNPTFFQLQYAIATWSFEWDPAEAERWYWEEFWPNSIYYDVNKPFEPVTYTGGAI